MAGNDPAARRVRKPSVQTTGGFLLPDRTMISR